MSRASPSASGNHDRLGNGLNSGSADPMGGGGSGSTRVRRAGTGDRESAAGTGIGSSGGGGGSSTGAFHGTSRHHRKQNVEESSDLFQGAQRLITSISSYYNITRESGLASLALPVWLLLSAWAISRIVVAANHYNHEASLYASTTRSVFDYANIWQIISAGLWLLALLYQFVVYGARRNQMSPTTTAVFMQGMVSVSVILYTDHRENGTAALIAVLPLIGIVFNGNTAVIALGWLLSTSNVLLTYISDAYFPSYFRYTADASPALFATVYVFTTFMILFVPLLYRHWLQKMVKDQEHMAHFITEVAELLVTMNTDDAMKAIMAEEGRMYAAATANGEAPSFITLQTTASFRRLVAALSKYRSYLPNNMFAPGAEDFSSGSSDDGEGGDSEDDDDHDESSSMTSGHRPPRTTRTAETSALPILDPYMLEKSHFRRRWSTVLCVSITSSVVDAAHVQDVGERFCMGVIPHVVSSRGVIDRLGPTCILATFNCHAPCVIHESEASQCALSIAAELTQHTDFHFTIVIASGYNYVGTCGVDSHRARVVLGEAVELVQRLAPLASHTLGCRILITEDTANKIGLETAPVDTIHLHPGTSPFASEAGRVLTLFELRSARKENAPVTLAAAFSAAFSAMRGGDFITAKGMFQNYMGRNPSDFQARRLAALCEPFAQEAYAQLQRLKLSVTTLHAPNTVRMAPYERREILWESYRSEEEFMKGNHADTNNANNNGLHHSSSSILGTSGAQPSSGPGGTTATGPQVGGTTFFVDTVRQHFQAQKLDYQEDGLVSMFLPVEDDEGQEQKPADCYPDHDALSTEVPRTFDDAAKNRWRRSTNSIGGGAFAELYLALGEQGDTVAMKCFNLANQRTQIEELIREVNTLSSLRNDYIVGYVGYAVTPNHFIILMEYVSGGSLLQMMQQFGPFPMAAAKRYLIDILKGLRYLHDHQTTHCDIKPHNALLANDGTCKLSDFGSAMNNQVHSEHPATFVNPDEQLIVRGTSWYLSPEAAKGEIRPSNDIWSLGVTFIELVTGKVPWDLRGISEANFIIKVGKDESMVPNMTDERLTTDALAFLQLCFQRNPDERPTAQQLLQHPFLTT